MECLEINGQKGCLDVRVEEVEQDVGGDGKATPGGSLRFSTESLDNPVQWTVLGWSGTVHAEIRVILPDGRYIICEAVGGGDPALYDQLSGIHGQPPTSDREWDLINLGESEP